jgi:hypothetical protein
VIQIVRKCDYCLVLLSSSDISNHGGPASGGFLEETSSSSQQHVGRGGKEDGELLVRGRAGAPEATILESGAFNMLSFAAIGPIQ